MPPELTLELLARRGEIRIGFQRHTPPFSFVLEGNFKPVGYAVDLAQDLVDQLALACRCPLSILPIETTSATREAMLLAGEFDIECGSTTITELRRQRVAFSRPIFCTGHRLALRREAAASPSRALRITGITGSTSHSALLREPIAGWHFEFRGCPSIGEAFDAYRHDSDIDGLIADEMILFGLLGQVGDEVTLVHEQRLGSEEYGFMLRQSDRELLVAVDRALEKSLGSGPFVQRLSRWLTPAPCQPVALASLFGNSTALLSLQARLPKACAKTNTTNTPNGEDL